MPDVRGCRDSEPAAATVYRDDSYRFSFSFTVTRTNATADPSGEICGSAIQVNLNRSFSVMNRFDCPCVDAAVTAIAHARTASDARRIMSGSNLQSICN